MYMYVYEYLSPVAPQQPPSHSPQLSTAFKETSESVVHVYRAAHTLSHKPCMVLGQFLMDKVEDSNLVSQASVFFRVRMRVRKGAGEGKEKYVW